MNTPRRQHGSMALTMGLLLIGLISILILVQIGYLYWAKRDAQKVADLAALSGAQRLPECDKAIATAAINADMNKPGQPEYRVEPTCGHWEPVSGSSVVVPAAKAEFNNAVKVRVTAKTGGLIPSLDMGIQPKATAVATKSKPIAAFSVGTTLATTEDESTLGQLLKGIGIPVADCDDTSANENEPCATSLAGYNGLADVNITPSGLLKQLDIPIGADTTVGDLNNLLATNGRDKKTLSVGQILDAIVTVAGKSELVDSNATLLDTISTKLNASLNENISLGGPDGIFAEIITTSADAALNTKVNALQLISTAIGIGTGNNAVDVGSLGILGGITVKTRIIEPPAIGIGSVGTTARGAQIQADINIDTDELPAISSLLMFLGTRIHLPLHVKVAGATAKLTSVECSHPEPSATFHVHSSLLNACIGEFKEGQTTCNNDMENTTLVKLFGAKVLKSKGNLYISGGIDEDEDIPIPPNTMHAGDIVSTDGYDLNIGSALDNIDDLVIKILDDAMSADDNESENISDLATYYLEKTKDSSNNRYNVDDVISLLRDGNQNEKLDGLGTWTVNKGVPTSCALLFTCMKDGPVWEGFKKTTNGTSGGILSDVTGPLLGLTSCGGIINNILGYNDCVRGNLKRYLETAPDGVINASNTPSDPDFDVSCNNLLCTLIKPTLNTLKPALNTVGNALNTLIKTQLGVELGKTDVRLTSLQCHPAQLVY